MMQCLQCDHLEACANVDHNFSLQAQACANLLQGAQQPHTTDLSKLFLTRLLGVKCLPFYFLGGFEGSCLGAPNHGDLAPGCVAWYEVLWEVHQITY